MGLSNLQTLSFQDSWAEILSDLQEEFGEKAYASWFSRMELQEIGEKKLTISVPSRFIRDWITTNYLKYLNRKIASYMEGILGVDFVVSSVPKPEAKPKCLTNDNQAKKDCEILSSRLNAKFKFENFVVGMSNKMAYNATKSVAEGKKLAGHSGIIYIHSKVGMGKTHLLQSVAAYVRDNQLDTKVAYLSAERFMHLFIKSVKNNDLINFKEKLRSADILVIDDLQFICGKAGTSQEFSNIVNSFVESDKKVIISADSSPYDMNLDSRTKSRLCGGLVIEIKAPSRDCRVKILKKLAELHNTEIDEKIISMIAGKITSSNRELEGALNKIISHEELFGDKIELEDAEKLIKDNIKAHNKALSVEAIIDAVAVFYDVKVSEILSKSRAKKFVLPRQICAYLAKQLTTKSLQEIGFKLGKRDHATVVYSVKKLEAEMEKCPEVAASVSKMIESLAG